MLADFNVTKYKDYIAGFRNKHYNIDPVNYVQIQPFFRYLTVALPL